MIKKHFILIFVFFLFSLIASPVSSSEADTVISIGGLVQSPVRFTMADLLRFRQSEISIDSTDGKSGLERENSKYRGVPLRALLELAKIHKYEFDDSIKTDNKIPTAWRINNSNKAWSLQDIAVVVKNDQGKQAVLSWGEIFLQNEDYVIVAIRSDSGAADGLKKQKSSNTELVFKQDNKRVRSLKNVCSIDVIKTKASSKEISGNQKPYISAGNSQRISLSEIYVKLQKINVPQGKSKSDGKNKNITMSGISLYAAIDELCRIKPNHTAVIAVVSKKGNTTAVSYGELQTKKGRHIIITENETGNSELKYGVTFPDDETQYRRIEDIHHIEIADLKQKPGIYVVGVGCGDTDLLTNEAISAIGRADAFICMEGYQNSLAGYIAGRPVLFDPFLQLGMFYKKKYPELSSEEAEKAAREAYKEDMKMIRTALDEDKIVVLLEPGDPTLFGGWRNWLSPNFPKETIKVIPGISSFNVANSMLGEINLTNGSVIITEPESLKTNESLIQSTARSGDVMVIFMGLGRMKNLIPQFAKYYSKDTPVYLIFFAGVAEKELKIKTTLERVVEDINSNNENFLGLIYIGQNLDSNKDSGNTGKFISDKLSN